MERIWNIFAAIVAALVLAAAVPAAAQVDGITGGGVVDPIRADGPNEVDALWVEGDSLWVRFTPTDAAVDLRAVPAIAATIVRFCLGDVTETDPDDPVRYAGVNYGQLKFKNNKIHFGGKTVTAPCSVSMLTPSMFPNVDGHVFAELVRLWPMLAEAHGRGHFTAEHLVLVLRQIDAKGFGLIAEQTLKAHLGADWKYFKAGPLYATVNAVEGRVIDVGSIHILVWRTGCMDGCRVAEIIKVNHLHEHMPERRAAKPARTAPTPPAPRPAAPAPAAASALTDGDPLRFGRCRTPCN